MVESMTDAKLDANRRNAQMSTGPRSATGKARSSRNALKHGLTAVTWTVLPDENAGQYTALLDRLTEDLAPANEVERLLVERIAQLTWRLHRAGRLETALMSYQIGKASESSLFADFFDKTTEPQNQLGLAVTRMIAALPLLTRYEGSIEKSLYRALTDLERRQEARGPTLPATPASGDESSPAPARQ